MLGRLFLFNVELPELYGLKGEPPNSCVESLTSKKKKRKPNLQAQRINVFGDKIFKEVINLK